MRLMVFFLCVTALLISSCSKKTDTETIRLFVNASDAYALGQFNLAAEILQKEKRFPPALILRAKAEYFSGDIEKAEKTWRRVIKLRPSSMEAHLYLARIFREKGDLAGAMNITENIITDNPQDIRSLRLAAELAMDVGKFDDAVILLNRAAEYSAESAMVLLDRARLRWIAGISDNSLQETVLQQAVLDDLRRAKAMLPWDTPLYRSIVNLENTIMGIH